MAPSPSSNSSKLKPKEKGTPKGVGGVGSQPLSQKQQMELLSPQNSELPKTSSISSLRDHLLASTTASASSSQQYASYSSPRMGGGDQQHQASPMTPSTNIPVTPESGSVLSPRVNAAPAVVAAATRQDSQLSSSGQSMDQDSYSRQNSSLGTVGVKGGVSTPPQPEEDNSRGGIPLPVERILGIQDDHPIDPPLVQSSPPISNSLRGGAGGGGSKSGSSNLSSPHATHSPLGSGGGSAGGGGMLTPNVVVGGVQDGRSPAPGRPELLGFPARSPSFRPENQPSPLTEDSKIVSVMSVNPKASVHVCSCLYSFAGKKTEHVTRGQEPSCEFPNKAHPLHHFQLMPTV